MHSTARTNANDVPMNRKQRKRGGQRRGGRQRSPSPQLQQQGAGRDTAVLKSAAQPPSWKAMACKIRTQEVATRVACAYTRAATATSTASASCGGHVYWDGGDVPRAQQRKRSYRQRLAKCLGCEECIAGGMFGASDGG